MDASVRVTMTRNTSTFAPLRSRYAAERETSPQRILPRMERVVQASDGRDCRRPWRHPLGIVLNGEHGHERADPSAPSGSAGC